MRVTAITVRNNQRVQLCVEKREEGFELWIVGPMDGRRVLLSHYLTHDDLEAHLEYAQPGDLVWGDASPEIPAAKDSYAITWEENLKQGVCYWDYIKPEDEEFDHFLPEADLERAKALRSVANHLSYPIGRLTIDRKEVNTARKRLVGQWTNGASTLTLEADRKLQWDPPLTACCHVPDRWDFTKWRLVQSNSEHKCHISAHVLHVDEHELLLRNYHCHRLVQVYYRIENAGDLVKGA